MNEKRKMSDPTKPENATGHGDYERSDLKASGILYFLLTIVVVTVICLFGLRGLFVFLDHREKALQPPVNPLLTHVPTDTRRIAPEYPQSAFPDPRLEIDERGQLNSIRMAEENTLHSYGWVDEKAGTVRIPIEHAMDLLAQRGLPVRSPGPGGEAATAGTETTGKKANQAGAGKKGAKK
jgi:hypothetical protein